MRLRELDIPVKWPQRGLQIVDEYPPHYLEGQLCCQKQPPAAIGVSISLAMNRETAKYLPGAKILRNLP